MAEGCRTKMDSVADSTPVVLSYAFRIFFLLVPLYLILSILLWGSIWSGLLLFNFTNALIEWHIYEMLYGLAGAGITGFLLTALPEFFENEKPVVGKTLFGLVVLWLIGRISFWLIDWLGVIPVAISHLAFMFWLLALVWRPIVFDPLRRHIGLLVALVLLVVIQCLYFAARLEWLWLYGLAVLKGSVGAFMILVLLVLRRVNTGITNQLLDQWQVDDVFLAKPPRYHVAVFMVGLFSLVEFFFADNVVLGWLGLAAAAAIFNLLNDWLESEHSLLWRYPLWCLWCIPLLMGLGYLFMGLDYLTDSFYGINHLRHFLLTGALGLAYLMVLYIVARVHTGREIVTDYWLVSSVVLVISATLVRASIAIFPDYMERGYGVSSLLWATAFAIYLYRFAPLLVKPRADGLPG